MFIIIRAVQPIYIHIANNTNRTMYQNGQELRGTAGIGRKRPYTLTDTYIHMIDTRQRLYLKRLKERLLLNLI